MPTMGKSLAEMAAAGVSGAVAGASAARFGAPHFRGGVHGYIEQRDKVHFTPMRGEINRIEGVVVRDSGHSGGAFSCLLSGSSRPTRRKG